MGGLALFYDCVSSYDSAQPRGAVLLEGYLEGEWRRNIYIINV